MARHRRNKGINLKGLRRKCAVTGKVTQVEHRLIELPQVIERSIQRKPRKQ